MTVLDLERPGIAERLQAVLDVDRTEQIAPNVVRIRAPPPPSPVRLQALAWAGHAAEQLRLARPPRP